MRAAALLHLDGVALAQRHAHLAVHREHDLLIGEQRDLDALGRREARSGRLVSVCEQIGVRTTASIVGNRMGPPAERE